MRISHFAAAATLVATCVSAQSLDLKYLGTIFTAADKRLSITLQFSDIPHDPFAADSIHATYRYQRGSGNIPLHGQLQRNGHLLLLEDGRNGKPGAVFDLEFIGNGTEGKTQLDFSNSTGFRGVWKQGNKALTVSLNRL